MPALCGLVRRNAAQQPQGTQYVQMGVTQPAYAQPPAAQPYIAQPVVGGAAAPMYATPVVVAQAQQPPVYKTDPVVLK